MRNKKRKPLKDLTQAEYEAMTPVERLTIMLARLLHMKDGVTDEYMTQIGQVARVPTQNASELGRLYTLDEIQEATRAARKMVYG